MPAGCTDGGGDTEFAETQDVIDSVAGVENSIAASTSAKASGVMPTRSALLNSSRRKTIVQFASSARLSIMRPILP